MTIEQIAAKYGNKPDRLMDILIDVQDEKGFIDHNSMQRIAEATGISTVDVEQTLSFYHFFRTKPSGKYVVYLNNSAVAEMMGRKNVAEAFEKAVGCKFGEVSPDGLFGLFETADIGMNDQEPAALINGVVFTSLTPEKVKDIVSALREGKTLESLVTKTGDGANSHPLMRTMVNNNIIKRGAVVFDDFKPGSALEKALSMTPESVLEEVKKSNVRGRGGAGFPVGMKWEFCRKSTGEKRYVLCNADEGEPGTFKDRVILTECPHMVFEGMVIAGWVLGATEGILYLRGEYRYMKRYLEEILAEMRSKKMLGNNIMGKKDFNFDIRIQLGAGAYVCGEESGLLESAEGKRGEPRVRPPFPVEKGYLDYPSVINNVETFCCVAKIVLKGGDWFKSIGTEKSSGTKVLSVSGDCAKPGIYEYPWGVTVKQVLDECGAKDVQAVQIGGPSGVCIAPKDFNRKICYSDCATGGSFIVIGKHRNLLSIVENFTAFFADESCGVCIPCRAGTQILARLLEKVKSGHGVSADLDTMLKVGDAMRCMSRCGLGQTAANPVVSTIQNFREVYDSLLNKNATFDTMFNLAAAVKESCEYSGRKPIIHDGH